MSVKSKIYLKEKVINQNPRARADTEYYIAYVEDENGKVKPALFTDFDIDKAVKRANANKEDVLAEQISWFKRAATWFKRFI